MPHLHQGSTAALGGLFCLCLALLMPSLALADTEFLSDKAFQYGMSQEDAARMIYGEKNRKDWEIAYDIATSSTWELAARHHEDVQYVVRFYQGRCIYVEKRAIMDGKDMETVTSKLFDENGSTGEVAGNRRESQLFVRWSREERAMELSAMRRTGGKFLVSYQDYDDETLSEALLVRDREIKDGRMVIDPLTGKAVPHVQSGEQQAEGDGSGAEPQEDPEQG